MCPSVDTYTSLIYVWNYVFLVVSKWLHQKWFLIYKLLLAKLYKKKETFKGVDLQDKTLLATHGGRESIEKAAIKAIKASHASLCI